ncbi:hypothetical protein LCGC14_0844470 [marine sediment metagenome]|uniref:Uncharacterized protein n=1 Tax=marine sediment metagenome TaxID=412755 RepID=A0A0F9SJA3_9ZZZZ
MDSSVDVCDLMISLLCAECPDRDCADDKSDDKGEPIWSHSKLMDCIREKWVNREELVKLDAFLDQRVSTEYPPKGHSYYYATGIDTAKERLKEILRTS